MRKNDMFRVDIEGMTDLGYGVARIKGITTFIAGAVTGDTADIKIIKAAKGYAVGRVEQYVEKSPIRESSPCTARGCGGCAYRDITREAELDIKRENVIHAFKKAGVIANVLPTRHTGITYHYRNKAQYPVSHERGEYRVGFYAPKSHRVVEAARCPLQPDIFGEIVECVRDHMMKYGISVYNEINGEGLVRHIYLRCAKDDNILVTLVLTEYSLPYENELAASLCALSDKICGVLINVNRDNTNVVCGSEYRTVWGRDYIEDTLCGVKLRIRPASFYQVNHDAAELLYTLARQSAELSGDEILIDLFCGAGSIGLSMAKYVREVIGIEIVPEAVACAKENAEINGIANARFFCGDANDPAGLLASAEREMGKKLVPDVVVVDPPRRGCGEELIEYLAKLAPKKIIYISCNPSTLARDCAGLIAHGYALGDVTPVDLFPRTGHVESVVCLTRQNDVI